MIRPNKAKALFRASSCDEKSKKSIFRTSLYRRHTYCICITYVCAIHTSHMYYSCSVDRAFLFFFSSIAGGPLRIPSLSSIGMYVPGVIVSYSLANARMYV